MKPSRRRRNARIIETTLALLVERYPAVFSMAEPRPLALGIRDAIVSDNPALRPNCIGTALRAYASAPDYLRKLVEGAERIGLDGQPCGTVTAEEAAHALEQPKARQGKPRIKSQPAIQSPPVPPKLSLSDLRAAAQRRKDRRLK